MIWLEAATAVLVDQIVTGNMILNYGTWSAIVYGGVYGADYTTVQGNVFRSVAGASGITRAGAGRWGSHTSIANNIGP